MPKVHVILITTRYQYSIPQLGEWNYGFVLMSRYLESLGFSITLLPSLPEKTTNVGSSPIVGYSHTRIDLFNTLKDIINKYDVLVFGIDALSDHYYDFLCTVKIVREICPNSIIVGGGPYFSRESEADKIGLSDSVELELFSGNVDAIVLGHCKSMGDICLGLRDSTIRCGDNWIIENIPIGVYVLQDNHVFGSGVSTLPKIDMPVVRLPDKQGNIRASIFIDSSCPNQCHYCSTIPASCTITSSTINTLKHIQDEIGPFRTNIIDNNPLFSNHSKNAIVTIRNEDIDTEFSIYLDEALFAFGRWKDILSICRDLCITGVFIGRESSDENVLHKMGRRLLNDTRTQNQLDSSFEGILHFIYESKEYIDIKLSYILSPFDSNISIRNTLTEINYILKELPSNSIVMNILCPYFGTKTRLEYKDILYFADIPHFINGKTILWKSDYNPGAFNLMCEFLKRKHDPESFFKDSLEISKICFTNSAIHNQPVTVMKTLKNIKEVIYDGTDKT